MAVTCERQRLLCWRKTLAAKFKTVNYISQCTNLKHKQLNEFNETPQPHLFVWTLYSKFERVG